MPDSHDSGFQWLNVKILESAGARGSMTEDEKDLHQIGGSMVSEFWRRHDDIIIRDLDERMVPYSDLLISNRDDRRVYELTLQGGVRVVCKTFTLVRIIRSEAPGHVIRNDYKVCAGSWYQLDSSLTMFSHRGFYASYTYGAKSNTKMSLNSSM